MYFQLQNSIITPVKLLKKLSKERNEVNDDPKPEDNPDVEEEDRIDAVTPEETSSNAEKSRESEKKLEERDTAEKEEEEENAEEADFNRLVDPEVEERVLVLTESVDDLRAELDEFKRVSTLERERLEKQVEDAREELKKVTATATDDADDKTQAEEKAYFGLAEAIADQFDDEGYMKCMLGN